MGMMMQWVSRDPEFRGTTVLLEGGASLHYCCHTLKGHACPFQPVWDWGCLGFKGTTSTCGDTLNAGFVLRAQLFLGTGVHVMAFAA